MSAALYKDFVRSKPFLVFGPGRTLFYAHGELLAKCSHVLSKDVHGEMKEKKLETIEIEDVDGDIDDDTVMRFIEFAYTGDYTEPDPDIVQLPTDSEELQDAFKGEALLRAAEDERDYTPPPPMRHRERYYSDKKKKKRMEFSPSSEPEPEQETVVHELEPPGPVLRIVDHDRGKHWEKFCSQTHIIEHPPWKPRDDNDEREDYTGIFLCHARLYKFSDRYGCDNLMNLTLQKLRLTLSKYRLHVERTSDVVELIRYTYTHTLDNAVKHDALRALVLDFSACYVHDLLQHRPFLELLQDGGSLPSELMVKIAEMVA